MSEQQTSAPPGQTTESPAAGQATATSVAQHSMDPVRKWVLVFAAFSLVLLAWYMAADRFTPFTTQARVNAFVVPIAPLVAGDLLTVDVTTNQRVKKGQLLATIRPEMHEVALAAAEAQLLLTRQNLRVSTASVEAAGAALAAARANLVHQRQNDTRLRQIAADEPGAISARRLDTAAAAYKEAEAQVASAEANQRKAVEALGPREEAKNPQLLAAQAVVAKARLDLAHTRLVAPNDGLVTDLRVDVGHFAAVGAPLMTFVAVDRMWVEANLTENNIGHVKPGDPVDLVLDVWPDTILRGRVRSVTHGVTAAESTSRPGGLPSVQNARDWLRNAQRFPVVIDFDDPEAAAKLGARVGSQVAVTVYTGEHLILNPLGRFVSWLSGLLSYAY